jgi:hypothetical protein
LVKFVVIWYIFPVLVFGTKKNLATLVRWLVRGKKNLGNKTVRVQTFNFFSEEVKIESIQ